MSTTHQSVMSLLEERGGARNLLDTLARVTAALDRHLVASFPGVVPKRPWTPSNWPDKRSLAAHIDTQKRTFDPHFIRQ